MNLDGQTFDGGCFDPREFGAGASEILRQRQTGPQHERRLRTNRTGFDRKFGRGAGVYHWRQEVQRRMSPIEAAVPAHRVKKQTYVSQSSANCGSGAQKLASVNRRFARARSLALCNLVPTRAIAKTTSIRLP